jgi:rhodanese-related sulfurtransferase
LRSSQNRIITDIRERQIHIKEVSKMRRKELFVRLIPAIFFAVLLVCPVGFMPTGAVAGQNSVSAPDFITAEQLKQKLASDQAVTVIDVRDTKSYINSPKIKGSIYFKLRKLSYRMTMPPLKDLPRDREVVTYCSCPHDEASIHAAKIFLDAGFKHVRVLHGGWQMWLKVSGPTEPGPRG